MKKLVFMFVALAAISFASCGNKTDNNAATTDSDSVSKVDTLNDSVKHDSTTAGDSVKNDSATQTPAA